jgi:TRAP-type C4-dicarboxylate transport system substrate-binding protein
MAKYLEPFDDTKDTYTDAITRANLDLNVSIKILADNRQKDIYRVFKANDLIKHMTNNDIVIVINEAVYDKLTEEQRIMVTEESLAGIHYDDEKEKVIITKGDVQTYSGLLRKFGYEKYEVLRESIKTIYNAEKEEEVA